MPFLLLIDIAVAVFHARHEGTVRFYLRVRQPRMNDTPSPICFRRCTPRHVFNSDAPQRARWRVLRYSAGNARLSPQYAAAAPKTSPNTAGCMIFTMQS